MIPRIDSTVNANNLLKLQGRLARKGFYSAMLQLRVDYNTAAQVLSQYLSYVYDPESKKPIKRIFPQSLPTQASGRWSVTSPPLTNFPENIRDVIVPDHDHLWACWDLDAIEAKIVAAYSHDREDLEAFHNGWDIHTMTACRMLHLELPPNLADPHQNPECAEWRNRLKWEGKEDKRRILAKCRYALLYGRNAAAIHGSKYERDFLKRGFTQKEIDSACQAFLSSKPNLTATKLRYWDQFAKAGEARTLLGRRRRLFGDYWMKAKEGFNHIIQGLVTDMTNLAIIELCSPPSPYILVHNAHDGCKISVPLSESIDSIRVFKQAVERDYTIEGETIRSTATWRIMWPDGKSEFI